MTDEKTLDELELAYGEFVNAGGPLQVCEANERLLVKLRDHAEAIIADSRKLAAVRAWHVENWDGIGPMPEPLQIIDGD